jgi:multiple sugar transport system permease protein
MAAGRGIERWGTRWVFAGPAMLFVATVVGYPIFEAFRMSFHRLDLTRGRERFVGLENYTRATADPDFWNALQVTLLFTIASVLIELVIGLVLAVLVNREIRGRAFFRTLFLLPMFVAPVVVGVTWFWMYNVEFGVINWALHLLGVGPQEWLGSSRLALPSIVLVDVWQQTSTVFIILLAALQAIPQEIYEAARVDGASAWRQFRNITLPFLRPAIGVVLTLRTMFALRAFDLIFVTTRGGPGRVTETISVYLYKVGFSQFNLGYSSALSVILLALILAFSIFYARAFRPSEGV